MSLSLEKNVVHAQSKYPVLHYGAFGATGFLFLGPLGSRG